MIKSGNLLDFNCFVFEGRQVLPSDSHTAHKESSYTEYVREWIDPLSCPMVDLDARCFLASRRSRLSVVLASYWPIIIYMVLKTLRCNFRGLEQTN